MRVPWKYIGGLVGGCLLSIGFFVAALYTQLGVASHQSHWINSITEKKERLAAQVAGPRLLIMAGSSGLFGINAELIQKETGIPTINMGTHAGIFLDYRLDRLKKIARPGDTVLMAWEYEHYTSGYTYSAEFTYDYILAYDPDYFRQMPLTDKIAMATRLPFKRLQKGWNNRRHGFYERPPAKPYAPYTPIQPGIDCLDENGDMVFNMASNKPVLPAEMQCDILVSGLPHGESDSFDVLASFISWAHANHITVLATYPQTLWNPLYGQPPAQKTFEIIRQFYTSHGVPFVGTPNSSMIWSRDDIFDGFYHPTHEGALKRTEELIPYLKPYLPAAH